MDQTLIINNLWMIIAAALVFIMNLGFACVETGLIRSKNATNVLFKNLLAPVLAIVTFAAFGFSILRHTGYEVLPGGFFAWGGFGLDAEQSNLDYSVNITYWTDFLFQTMLAATAVTIIAGAVAERIKLVSFLLFAFIFLSFIYPVVALWHWGGGWLSTLTTPFKDFAGASIVHTVGGYGALMGAIMLGPRIGKYGEGRINPIPGHNMSLAVIGLFMLWLGWFGFNGGAALSTDPSLISRILVTTFLSGAAGCLAAFGVSYLIFRTHDITMSINGILAGLVGITAGADVMSTLEACIIGTIAGSLVVFSVLIFDRMKVDDPVGAVSVHLVCGTWGTLAVGIFGKLKGPDQILSQLIGCAAIGIFTCTVSFLILLLIRKTLGLRVSQKQELEGLDLGEHGMKAYTFDAENRF
ncbi:MAG: ammonium transporter [Cytophagaceae bacterium]